MCPRFREWFQPSGISLGYKFRLLCIVFGHIFSYIWYLIRPDSEIVRCLFVFVAVLFHAGLIVYALLLEISPNTCSGNKLSTFNEHLLFLICYFSVYCYCFGLLFRAPAAHLHYKFTEIPHHQSTSRPGFYRYDVSLLRAFDMLSFFRLSWND